MSPKVAPESDEPYWAIASFSSATSSALIETVTLCGAAVELHHAAVDLLADGEAFRPLLGAVARELRALDEGRELGADDLDVDTAFLDLSDLAGDDRAFLQLAGRLRRNAHRRRRAA